MKKPKNKKAFLSTVSILFIVLIITTTTFFQAVINPDYWKTDEFISKMLINMSIVLFGVVSGYGEGDNYYKNLASGLYMVTYERYCLLREKIDNVLDKFPDWNNHQYKKELTDKRLKYLQNEYGVKQAEDLLNLDREDIATLTSPQLINGTHFQSLNKEQINAVLCVLDGKIKLKFVHDDYFLNAFSSSKNKSMYEQAGGQEKSQKTKFLGLVSYRLIMSIVFALILSGLQIDINSGVTMEQIWVNLVVRLFTLSLSITWGFFISNEMVKDDSMFLDYKAKTINVFDLEVVVNKTFNAKTIEELAKEEYENEKNGRIKRQDEINNENQE